MPPAGLRYEWRADRRVAASLARRRGAVRGTGRLRAPDGGPLDCRSSGGVPARHPEVTSALTPSASETASRPLEALASAPGVCCARPCIWLRIDVRTFSGLPCPAGKSHHTSFIALGSWLG